MKKYAPINTLVVRMVSWLSSLPSMRTGATTCGCSACLSSLRKVLPRMRRRLTLMPPPVLPAQAPMNMSTTRISLERVGHRSKSQLEKPVVVMMEPT